MTSSAEALALLPLFEIAGEPVAAAPLSSGHIHASYVTTCRAGDATRRYLLQRLNADIFRAPEHVQENIVRVTAHLRARLAQAGTTDLERRVLRLVPARAGGTLARDAAGGAWRVYEFIERTRVDLCVTTPAQAAATGRAYGEFQGLLADYAGPRLHETIPDFHNTPLRMERLAAAASADTCGRAAGCGRELDFVARHADLAPRLVALLHDGTLPERIVHNDAKISNVLFDEASGAQLCVTDLDTVMPGTVLFDVGDMLRSMSCTAAEDEPDLARVTVQRPLVTALLQGYLAAAGSFLTSAERRHLVLAGLVITFEQGVRFLTDYLAGDTYYRTTRPGQNLDRTRTQFQLVAELAAARQELETLVSE